MPKSLLTGIRRQVFRDGSGLFARKLRSEAGVLCLLNDGVVTKVALVAPLKAPSVRELQNPSPALVGME